MENIPCGAEGLSCTKSVKVTLMGSIIHLVRGAQPIVSENPAWPLAYDPGVIGIHHVGVDLTIDTPYGESRPVMGHSVVSHSVAVSESCSLHLIRNASDDPNVSIV